MKKPPTEEEQIVREGLLNSLEPESFERLFRRILKTLKLSPEREEELLKETIAARARTQKAFKRTLD